MSDNFGTQIEAVINHAASWTLVKLAALGLGYTGLDATDEVVSDATGVAHAQAEARGLPEEAHGAITHQAIANKAKEMGAAGVDAHEVMAATAHQVPAEPEQAAADAATLPAADPDQT